MKNKYILVIFIYSIFNCAHAQNPGYLGSKNAIQVSANLGMNKRELFNVIPRIKYERSKSTRRSFSINFDVWAGSLSPYYNWNGASFLDNNDQRISFVSGSIDYLHLSVELSKRYYKPNASAPFGKYWELAVAADFIKFLNDLTVWSDPDLMKNYPFQTAIIPSIILRHGIRRMLSDHIGLDLNAGIILLSWENVLSWNPPTTSGVNFIYPSNKNILQTNIGLSYLF